MRNSQASWVSQPRATRRKAIIISSDAEDNDDNPSLDEEPLKPVKRTTGKLKSINKAKKVLATPATSITDDPSQASPAKPKASKARAKPAVKQDPKTKAKPIYSFFNAATQRQRQRQPSQPSLSPEKPPTPREDVEGIDGSDDDNSTHQVFAQGSSTALAVRKRKVQHSQSFEEDASLPPPATQKFRKTSDDGRTPSFSLNNDDKRPWTDQFAPLDLSELAVHKKKVADVRHWFESAFSGKRQKVLVLKGAAGSGKTATVTLLAKVLASEVLEWKNPAGLEYGSEGSAPAAMQFEDFLARAGGAGGLQFTTDDGHKGAVVEHSEHDQDIALDMKRQILLIEEFPNTFSRTSTALQSFRSVIMQYVSASPVPHTTPVPLVMIISETLLSTSTAAADSFTAHRLLGPEILNHPYVDMIEFNAVAPTILTKALENIVIREARISGRRKTPSPQIIKRLADFGDIRSAISSLEFLCLRGDDGDTWSAKVVFTKPKKAKAEQPLTKAEEETLKLISNRESSLGIFHSVGKIVYNKRTEPPPQTEPAQPWPWLPQHRRTKIPETDVNRLLDELGTDTSTFIAALHENYALSCGTSTAEDMLASLTSCIDSISDADLLSPDRFSFSTRAFWGSATDTLRQDEMAFQVAVRGLLFSLPCPVHRSMPADGKKGDAHKMFYPVSLKLWRKKEEIEGTLDLLTARLQRGGLSMTSAGPVPPKGDGVASWKPPDYATYATPTSQSSATENVLSGTPNSAKMEMLTDRLPYMPSILTTRSDAARSTFLDQVLSVTRVRGLGLVADEEEVDAEDGELDVQAVEPWATDQPDAGPSAKVKSAGRKINGRQKGETEGGGLHIPVESAVEKLVLEDDDIVDD